MGNDEDALGPAPERPARDTALMFGGGVAVGAAVLGLIWMFISLVGGGSGDAPESSGSGQVAPLSASKPAQAQPTRMELCRSAASALTAPLEAAGPAMDQWAVHIGAMNKLVVGAISLKQATAFWNQTRVGAQGRIEHFRAAVRTLRGHDVSCPSPSLVRPSEGVALRSCARQVSADLQTLDAARTAVHTWHMHVLDMDRLRAGTLAPATATKMWLAMWQRGQAQLDAYRDAVRSARRAGGCSTAQPGLPQPPSMTMSNDLPGT
ncbi:hypothetical protein [Nocardioides sp. CER19]|uniref:hypothetical protein n=1 Tax=Nocardioides sp. CER19 TaxID=3038538 RepID=UPI0024498EEA|nr:hypothetical protein [Nocardioides sp. CER19]MDH2414583.1 hypothetical protein [Nocardioides sp. CER19]